MSSYQLFQVPTLLTGEESTLLVSFCIPDTPDWRQTVRGLVGLLARGRRYDASTGNVKGAKTIGEEILNSMSMCNLDDLRADIRRLTDAITGGQLDPTQEGALDPEPWDYSSTGLIPRFEKYFMLDHIVYPDEGVASVLAKALIADTPDLPLPFTGTGLADITDTRLQILGNRLRMTDGSIFNPLNDEKNIVEVLETTLRTDKFSDLEFLTPNIVTVMNQIFKIDSTSPLTAGILALITLITGVEFDPPPEYNTTAELLFLIAEQLSQSAQQPQPVDVDLTTTVICSCGGSGCGGCSGGGIPSDGGSQGGDPPNGWTDPENDQGEPITPGEPAYADRKCFYSNAVHFQIKELIHQINLNPIMQAIISEGGDLAGTLGFTALTYIIGELSIPPIPLLDGVVSGAAGFLTSIFLRLIGEGVDLAQLELDLGNNDEDLVCALYNSSSSAGAIADYLGVLDNYGTSAGNQLIISSILVIDVVNFVFFEKSQLSEAFRELGKTWNPPIDCANCGCSHIVTGNILSDTGAVISIQSVVVSGDYRAQIVFYDECFSADVTDLVITSGSVTNPTAPIDAYRIYSEGYAPGPGSDGDLWSSDSIPNGFPYTPVRAIAIVSNDEFTVEIDYNQVAP